MYFYNMNEYIKKCDYTFSSLTILEAKYVDLRQWTFDDLTAPYWRLYWNQSDSGYIIYNGVKTVLIPGKIYLIPPNTTFRSSLKPKSKTTKNGHFFIHFTLGHPFDTVSPTIFSFDDSCLIEKISSISVHHTDKGNSRYSGFTIFNIVTSALMHIPDENWNLELHDERISKVISYMDNNFHAPINNNDLAKRCYMSRESFIRLFKQKIGTPPKKYLQRIRIDHACVLLHHSDMSIEEIAERCGFTDRAYFSRVFSQLRFTSPAKFRKENSMR